MSTPATQPPARRRPTRRLPSLTPLPTLPPLPDAPDYLPATAASVLWGRLPCETDAPVLTVEPGALVTIDTVSHEGLLEDQGGDPLTFFGSHGVAAGDVLPDAVQVARSVSRDPDQDGPHVVTGPIRVRGARAGDLLGITLVEARPRVGYGVISNRHGRGALPGEFPRQEDAVSVFARAGYGPDATLVGRMALAPGAAEEVEFPLRPFLGIIGVAVEGGQRPHSVPPGPHGGNVDIAALVPGSTLYLPVQVDGALAYVGDPHYAQGDGEVALTAMEAPLRVRVRFSVLRSGTAAAEFGHRRWPLGLTDSHVIPTGQDVDLDEAMRACVREAIDTLEARYGMSPEHALAYLSAATDFRISQVVDRVCGVHALISRRDFGDLP